MALYSNTAPKQKNSVLKRHRRNIIGNGLYGKRYLGYCGGTGPLGVDDPNWFATATLHGDVNQLTTFNRFSSSPDRNSESTYSWQWLGYFLASTNEDYTFYTNSDDESYLWIGSNATAGFTTANATVNNGTPHALQERSGSVSLIAGIYYPIRIQFGEAYGGDEISVSFTTPTIGRLNNGTTNYSNGLGYFYYNPATNGF
jgi:hypothetical protein